MSTLEKICIVVSDPITVQAFLRDQIELLSSYYDVTVVMNAATDEQWTTAFPKVNFKQIGIVRPIRISADFKALFDLSIFFRRQKFTLVHSVTPKAGLLAMLAARFAAVPHRIHTFTGQVWATRQGVSRFFFKSIDRLMGMLASEVLIDSFSQRDFLISESVLKASQGTVLGSGSISGVDIGKFSTKPEIKREVKRELRIPEDSLVFLFLGRLNRDKGILDLAEAFRLFRLAGLDGHLLIVGPDETDLQPVVMAAISQFQDQVHFVGMTRTPERYMAAADVFCLPSYREGFGSVIIEAASCGIPAIGSRIYGIVDAIVEGETGLLHEARSAEQLCQCMRRLAEDAELRITMGKSARQRATQHFSKEILSRALLNFYRDLMQP